MTQKTNKRGSSALDSLMAGFAAGAAAFIIYAMPQARFDEVIALSGLPMLVSAAQPPLGMTARFAVMAAAGIGSFLLVWQVLRALGKPAPRRKSRADLEEIEMAPPRLRRADMHPDAPSRRPLLAAVELGRSFDELPAEDDQPEDEPEAEQDDFLGEGQPLYDRSIYGEQPAEESETAYTAIEEDFQDEAVDSFEPALGSFDELESDPDNFMAEQPEVSDDFAAEPAELAEEEQPADSLEDEPANDPPVPSPEMIWSRSDHAPQPVKAQAGIAELVQRLEAGLARRRPNRWSQPADETSNGAASIPAAGPLDARLRGAIDELQKLASRGN